MKTSKWTKKRLENVQILKLDDEFIFKICRFSTYDTLPSRKDFREDIIARQEVTRKSEKLIEMAYEAIKKEWERLKETEDTPKLMIFSD